MNNWVLLENDNYNIVNINPFTSKTITNIILNDSNKVSLNDKRTWVTATGLWIIHSDTCINICRKNNKGYILNEWGDINENISKISIYQCEDGWIKMKVFHSTSYISYMRKFFQRSIGESRTFLCDQEFGVRDFLKYLKII